MNKEIEEMFAGRKDAWFFLTTYIQYIHCIDDNIDEEKCRDRILQHTKLAAVLFNSDYWKKYQGNLVLVERLIFNAYRDSVEWENSEVGWKIRDSKVLNQLGYNMIFAIILIEFGEDKLNEFSLKFREWSHLNQGHDKL